MNTFDRQSNSTDCFPFPDTGDSEPCEADDVSELYASYFPALTRSLGRIVGATAAEDAAQESFARLLIELQAGRAPTRPRAWLFRVGSNIALSQRRRERSAQRASHALVSTAMEPSPEERAIAQEGRAHLERVLASVHPDAARLVIATAKGYSPQELSLAVGCSGGTLRTRLCRARAQVRAVAQAW